MVEKSYDERIYKLSKIFTACVIIAVLFASAALADNKISGSHNTIDENGVTINGNNNTINTSNSQINGNHNTIHGDNNTIRGNNNIIHGENNKITGNHNSFTPGAGNKVNGNNNTEMERTTAEEIIE